MADFMSQALARVMTVTAGATLVLVVLIMASCVMTVSESGEEAAAKITATIELEKQRSAAIEKLVSDHGVNPIAARCAIMGWARNSKTSMGICRDAANNPVLVQPGKPTQ